MNVSDITKSIQELKNLQQFSKCPVCKKNSQTLGRVKICGHYVCENCLKKSDLSCPKCKVFCNSTHIDWKNNFSTTNEQLKSIREILSNIINTDNASLKINTDNASLKKKVNNNFIYENKTYHVNYVEEQRVNAKGETPLHVACKRKKIEDVKKLLETKVDINAQDFAGWVPMHEAIESNCEEIVTMLIEHGALLNVPGEDNTTPLHKAALSGNIQIIELLLDKGANKDSIDYFGKKPIDCIINTPEVLKVFNKERKSVERIQQLFFKKKIVPYCYYVEPAYKNKLVQQKIKIEEKYNPKKVTHFIIRRTHKLSVNILLAMLDGCLIVPQEWVDNYLQEDYFIPIPDYNFIHLNLLNSGIQKAMINKILRLPKLFSGVNFYIHGHINPVKILDIKISKESLTSIINAGGGKILRRAPTPSVCEEKINFPYHASKTNKKCCNYIIYESLNPPVLMYHMEELKHKSSQWLIDCVINFTILH